MVPWTMLEMDLFTLDSPTFLLVVDVMSRFSVVRILNTESCRSVLNALKGIYCDFGLPERVITDNGPCFKAVDYIEFYKKLGIKVEKSSAYNHQSVGMVERMVQTVKQIMTKNPDNAWLAMLIFKATQIPNINKSPSELLNSRKFRMNLPSIEINQGKNEPEIEMLIDKHLHESTTGKELPKLDVGTPILYGKNPDSSKIKCPQWCKGTVKDRHNPRKYEILTDNDRIVTRSRHHIKAYLTKSGRVSKAPKRLIEQ